MAVAAGALIIVNKFVCRSTLQLGGPATGRGQSTGPLRHSPQSNSNARSQDHETLGTMTAIIMRTSHDNRTWSFSALFQGFPISGNLPISLVLHEAPTGTRK